MAKRKIAKKKSSAEKTSESNLSFEESLAELERVVTELEGGNLGLSESLASYEQGVKHLAACNSQLELAERKIELLSGVDSDGNPITEPFEAEADSLAQKSAARGKRRSRPTKTASRAKIATDAEVDDDGRLF